MTDDDHNDDTPREHPVTNSDRIAKLEERGDEHHIDIASLLASRSTWRWIAGLGATALLGAVVTVMLWSVDRVSVSSERTGETKAKIDALDNLIRLLQADIAQLRQRAGLDLKPTSDTWSPPDKFSLSPPKDPHVLVSNP